MRLGTCYYPEHWDEARWADDAARMAAAGLTRVRIAEFAWSRIEPEPGRFDWGWLDRAIGVLHDAGLGVILCTPSATPPKWLVDAMPDMLAHDREGRPRGFGSRRHYCFSHAGYRAQAVRIAAAVADRYGRHPAVAGWQIDNEYGCHDTVLSYSPAARAGFRRWLEQRHGSIDRLNHSWGTVFWSMEYNSFDAIELPHLTVTEANPAHWLDFRRYSSDQVITFHRAQVEAVRARSPGRAIMHNAMGFFAEFDHHALGRECDVIGWDSYPLGFLDSFGFAEHDKLAFARTGHPDIAAFHHDLYRGCTADGRWAVLEQQPGPVNWARHNPAPLPGMVRLWTLEALAHGAELVSYFRWRQFPRAQEQHHAGLLRPDHAPAPALAEVTRAAAEIAALGQHRATHAPVALVFAYDAEWVTAIQPQGAGLSALWAAFACYSALRRLGLDIDIVAPDADLAGYRLCVVPCLPIVPAGLAGQLARFAGEVVIGPRSGSRDADFAIPETLPPGPLAAMLGIKITLVESLRPGVEHRAADQGWAITRWLEAITGTAEPEYVADDGQVAVWRHGRCRYLAAWPAAGLAEAVLERAARDAGLDPVVLPDGVRLRRHGPYRFAFNFAATPQALPDSIAGTPVLGDRVLPPAGLCVLAGANEARCAEK